MTTQLNNNIPTLDEVIVYRFDNQRKNIFVKGIPVNQTIPFEK